MVRGRSRINAATSGLFKSQTNYVHLTRSHSDAYASKTAGRMDELFHLPYHTVATLYHWCCWLFYLIYIYIFFSLEHKIRQTQIRSDIFISCIKANGVQPRLAHSALPYIFCKKCDAGKFDSCKMTSAGGENKLISTDLVGECLQMCFFFIYFL